MCSNDLSLSMIGKGSSVVGFRMNCSHGYRPLLNRALLTTVCRCNACGLVYTDPMPLPQDIQDHYSAQSGDDYHVLGEWHDDWFKPQIQSFVRLHSKSPRDAKALDVGCGTYHGLNSLLLAGFDAFGIEPSNTFYNEIITSFPSLESRVLNQTLDNAVLTMGSFDFITFGAVLEHLPYPSEALIKASKLLSKGGLIHVEVPNANWFIADLMDFFSRLRGFFLTTRTSPMHSPFHLYEFSESSFRYFASKNGLEVVSCRSFASSVPYFPSIFKPFISYYMRAARRCMQLEIWLRKS